jgi:predicted GNAT family N-acyltransferase
MSAEIGLVWNRPNDRLFLLRLREWTAANRPFLQKLGLGPPVQPFHCPNDALSWRDERPKERLVVTAGFSRSEIEAARKFIVASGEPIIVNEPNPVDSTCNVASASFITNDSVVTCRDVRPQIRKSLIRVALRSRVEIRPPVSDEEFAGYFSLRYKVWKSIGYLREENKKSLTEWEVDFWDRTALPLCAIDRNGRVIGCARLIRPYGAEQGYTNQIQCLLDKRNDAVLKELFRFPNGAQLPFDILFEFRGFGSYYKDLVKAKSKVAEIGRVAVDPNQRGNFLSEALVDTTLSFAKQSNVSQVFLACHEQLSSLYAKCGFMPVPGVRSDKFFNIALPSIVMEKRL